MGGCLLWIAFMCMCIYLMGPMGIIVGIGFTALAAYLEA